MEYEINHLPETRRFEICIGGETAYEEYIPFEGGIDLAHTFVPKSLEGQGVAAALVRAALDYARIHQLKVKASCSYVIVYLKRHPEHDLI